MDAKYWSNIDEFRSNFIKLMNLQIIGPTYFFIGLDMVWLVWVD